MVQPWHSALFLLYLSGIQEVLIFRNSSSPSRLAIGQLLHPLLRYTSPKRMHGQKENSPGWKFCYACYFCNIYLIFFNFSKKKKKRREGRQGSKFSPSADPTGPQSTLWTPWDYWNRRGFGSNAWDKAFWTHFWLILGITSPFQYGKVERKPRDGEEKAHFEVKSESHVWTDPGCHASCQLLALFSKHKNQLHPHIPIFFFSPGIFEQRKALNIKEAIKLFQYFPKSQKLPCSEKNKKK